jgi:hypothetical protein
MPSIEPCRDPAPLRRYIDEHWRKNHVLARDERMFAFQYQTPWVDRAAFPQGISVLGAYEGSELIGFIGAIAAPYPRKRSSWLALWHVRPDLKSSGMGGKLLQAMQDRAVGPDSTGWIGTFGAGPAALPVYLKRGYACRAVRRWLYDPRSAPDAAMAAPASLHSTESEAGEAWLDYRYARHPLFKYEILPGGIFRTERNAWGLVTHALLLRDDWRAEAARIHARDAALADREGVAHLMDAWSFGRPGPGWELAPDDLPSVFSPPEARGNLIYATGFPFTPARVQKGDCDQDRPN